MKGARAAIIGRWLAQLEVGALLQLAVDGKVLQGSGRHDGKPLQLRSAGTRQSRLTLDQVPIGKSSQLPAHEPPLQKINPPPGVGNTAAALHCQQETPRSISRELDGDYHFGLKGNKGWILDKAKRLLDQMAFSP